MISLGLRLLHDSAQRGSCVAMNWLERVSGVARAATTPDAPANPNEPSGYRDFTLRNAFAQVRLATFFLGEGRRFAAATKLRLAMRLFVQFVKLANLPDDGQSFVGTKSIVEIAPLLPEDHEVQETIERLCHMPMFYTLSVSGIALIPPTKVQLAEAIQDASQLASSIAMLYAHILPAGRAHHYVSGLPSNGALTGRQGQDAST